jgi:uncharacterized membrane protein YccF (DUF307 family)
MLRFIGNVIWLLLAGLPLAIGYAAFGLLAFILIITIPFGIASFRLARYALWPFGRTVVRRPSAGAGAMIGNVIWFFIAGLWLAVAHIASGIALFLTIIGIPFGIANFKMAVLALFPLGKDIVDSDDPVAANSGVHSVAQVGR